MTFTTQLRTSGLNARAIAAGVSPLLPVRTVESWLAGRRLPAPWAQELVLRRVEVARTAPDRYTVLFRQIAAPR